MTEHEQRATIFGAIAATAGMFLACYLEQGHLFARSGAVITVVAVWFASLELRKRLERTALFVEEQLRQARPANLKTALAAGLSSADAEKRVRKVEEEIRAESSSVAAKISKRILRAEVLLLVAGTLIWGFGDLPLDFLFRWLEQDQCLDAGGKWIADTRLCER